MKTIVTLILTTTYFISFGQEITEKEIDDELLISLDSHENYTTQGMTQCMFEATKKYEILLNLKYNQLISILKNEQRESLKIAQKEWLKFRDQELIFSNEFYNNMEGTIWIPVAAETNLNLTRQRVSELDKYISILIIED